MAEQVWPAQWMRGVLELCVLALVAEHETYGYELAQRLEAAGLGRVKGGTLYPILMRLADDGLVSAIWRDGDSGPGRKFFQVTEPGLAELRQRQDDWTAFTTVTNALLAQAAKTTKGE